MKRHHIAFEGALCALAGTLLFASPLAASAEIASGGGGSSVINADAPGSEDVDATSDKGSGPENASEPNAAQAVYVSNQGSDENGNGTEEKPFASLAEAVGRASDGATIYLLSDIDINEMAYVNEKSLTVNGGGFTVTRSQEFGQSQDENRGGFNGGMFEVANRATLRLENIVLDDAMLHKGTDFLEEKNGKGRH